MSTVPVLPGKTVVQKADSKRRRSLRPKYRLIGVKLFFATDGDLIQWWESSPDGEKSDVLRTSIRDYLARLKHDPHPATDQDVIGQTDRVLSYTEQAAQWVVNEQQRHTDALTKQIAALTLQLADLTARLASGVILQSQASDTPADVDPTINTLTSEQAAARKAKVVARKW